MEMRSSASSCSGLGSWCSPLLHSWWPRTTSFASACRKIHSRSSTPNLASLSWWETTTSPTPPLWTCSSRATSPGLFQLRPEATSWKILVWLGKAHLRSSICRPRSPRWCSLETLA
eukprot:Mycagemm_TRINITY_DN10268_c0_g1::TRINITY_DN10268_c0_g1_i1::g.3948::m.3948 type:complete len:116 gc:universal TRINITY_DN10268_c0_g1_i1:1756-2103(+)